MKSAGKARSNGLYRHIRTSKEIIRNLLNYYWKRKIFVLTADVENRGYLDTLKEIAEQKKDCGVKVFMDKKA